MYEDSDCSRERWRSHLNASVVPAPTTLTIWELVSVVNTPSTEETRLTHNYIKSWGDSKRPCGLYMAAPDSSPLPRVILAHVSIEPI